MTSWPPSPMALGTSPRADLGAARGRWWVWVLFALFALGVGLHFALPAPAFAWRPTARHAWEQMQQFARAVEHYRRRHGRLPVELPDLARPEPDLGAAYFKHIPLDPWGRPYRYVVRPPGTGFEFASAGEDGLWGTDDDVTAP